MNKSQFYLSQCVEAASKARKLFPIVKGGKVISTGFNHQRPNYECREPLGRAALANGLPFSMHAEMAAIFKLTRGEAPALKQQALRREEQNLSARKQEGAHRDFYHHRSPSVAPHNGKAQRTFYPSNYHHYEQDQNMQQQQQQQQHASERDLRDTSQRSRTGVKEQGRSRYPRLNGADLYVCRTTKHGFGCSKPCWRCVDWCAWAGIKRIFYWSDAEGRFVCIKVNGHESQDFYQTSTDERWSVAQALERGAPPPDRTLSLNSKRRTRS
ncbi:hypothetical protein C8J57DRAFT_1603493 [Mycena rebaudengoi]|nr:hypothetical protein C8J57DRAFT_1603493 [Mycena rebaudengoi]